MRGVLSDKINSRIEPRVPGLYRFGDSRHIVSDISKLGQLGWAPTKDIHAIADEYIAWAAEQPGLRDYHADAEEGMLAAAPCGGRTGRKNRLDWRALRQRKTNRFLYSEILCVFLKRAYSKNPCLLRALRFVSR